MTGPEQISDQEVVDRIKAARARQGINEDGTLPDPAKPVAESLPLTEENADAFATAVIERYKDYDLTK